MCPISERKIQIPIRSEIVRRSCKALPRTVNAMTDFGNRPDLEARYNKPEVWPCYENKAIVRHPTGTKVTSCFGPGSANIKPDCVIP
jgi:hypothetical protein